MSQAQETLIRLPEVVRLTGLSKPSIYRLVKAKQFPKQVKLSVRAVAWSSSDVATWIDSRVAVV